MKLPRIFYDPDNLASLYAWGVRPRCARRKRRAWIRMLFDAVALTLLWSGLEVWLSFNDSGEDWMVDTLRAIFGVFGGYLYLMLALIRTMARCGEPRELDSVFWRDVGLAGVPRSLIFSGLIGPRLAGLPLACTVHWIVSVLAMARSMSHDTYVVVNVSNVHLYAVPLLQGLAGISLHVLPVLFFLVGAQLLDIANQSRRRGLIGRLRDLAILAVSSPLLAGVFWAMLFPLLHDMRYPGLILVLECLSWPVRGWVVWRVWQSAIRTMDEEDVP